MSEISLNLNFEKIAVYCGILPIMIMLYFLCVLVFWKDRLCAYIARRNPSIMIAVAFMEVLTLSMEFFTQIFKEWRNQGHCRIIHLMMCVSLLKIYNKICIAFLYSIRLVCYITIFSPSWRHKYPKMLKQGFSKKMGIWICCFLYILCLSFIFSASFTSHWKGCEDFFILQIFGRAHFYFLVLLGLFLSSMLFALYCKIRHIKDAFSVSQELRCLISGWFLLFLALALLHFLMIFASLPRFGIRYFMLTSLATLYCSFWLPIYKARRARKKSRRTVPYKVPLPPTQPTDRKSTRQRQPKLNDKHKHSDDMMETIQDFDFTVISIQDIHGHSKAWGLFYDHVKRYFCEELVLFYEEFHSWTESLSTLSNEDQFQTYQSLVEKFIEEDAPYEVNIADEQRRALTEISQADFDGLSLSGKASLVSETMNEICNVLKTNFLLSFKEDLGEFDDILNEICDRKMNNTRREFIVSNQFHSKLSSLNDHISKS